MQLFRTILHPCKNSDSCTFQSSQQQTWRGEAALHIGDGESKKWQHVSLSGVLYLMSLVFILVAFTQAILAKD